MTTKERRLLAQMRRANSYDHAEGVEVVAPIVTSPKGPFKLGPGAYNPNFIAQIQVRVFHAYFSEAAGVFTPVLPAAVPAPLQVKLPFFLFADSDFRSGYTKLAQQFPVTGGWVQQVPKAYGKDSPALNDGTVYDANVTALLQGGDIVIAYRASSGGTDYVAFMVVRSDDVAMSKLLQTTEGNSFGINLIRMTVADTTAANLAQYANALNVSNETMFGKFTTDTVNPNGYKNPEQQQENIIDIDINVSINKEKGIASFKNYDAGAIVFNLFINEVTKL